MTNQPITHCWMQPVLGQAFDLVNLDPALITVDLLAASLSKLTRFTGHTTIFYLVAEHSCRLAAV